MRDRGDRSSQRFTGRSALPRLASVAIPGVPRQRCNKRERKGNVEVFDDFGPVGQALGRVVHASPQDRAPQDRGGTADLYR